jgi:hypothetical protein
MRTGDYSGEPREAKTMNERARMTALRRARQRRALQARPRLDRAETLVSLASAARKLGVHEDSITSWFKTGAVPVVRTPGGTRYTYVSWLHAVMTCARPGVAGDMRAVTDAWWDEHFPGTRKAAA